MDSKIDVLLVRPVNKSQQIVPQLSLGYLATALRRNNFSVGILDCVKEGFGYSEFLEYTLGAKPRIIGFQAFTVDMLSVKKSIAMLRERSPDIFTVVGGAHPSGAAGDTLAYLDQADFAFRGEAETGLPKLTRSILGGGIDEEAARGIPGLVWRKDREILVNNPAYPDDLDELGFPSWDLLRPDIYPEAVQGYFFKQFPVAPIIATRGCPYNCTFCAAKLINAQKIRRRSIPNIIEEIKLLHSDYGIREIHIVDDNFSFYRDYIEDFCRQLLKANLGISWRCANSIRLDTADKDILGLMKESGCYCVSFGIESGSDRILRLMKKQFTTKDISDRVAVANQAGIDVNGSFILGYPGESEEEIQGTIRFSRRLGIKMANFNCLIPLPGTQVYEDLKAQGKLTNLKWEDYTYSKVVYVPDGLSEKKLKAYQRKAILGFYMRPGILWHLIRSIRNFKHFRYIVKAALTYILPKE
jgi:radical SAM superfamily enzyme YgiQ (UPF0313 family)